MSEKIYVGSGKEKFDGDMVNITVNLSIVKLATNHIYSDTKGSKWIRLNVVKRKDGADDYGNTHYVAVDTWKPQTPKTKAENKKPPELNDLPF